MNKFRSIGYYIDTMLNDDVNKRNEFCRTLNFSKTDLNKLCEGRLGLTPVQLGKTSLFFGKPVSDILNYNNTDLYAKRVHCRTDFSKQENCEKILDIIDSYIDVKESV